MSGVCGSTVEDAVLAWLSNLAWNVAHGPDVAPVTPGAERRTTDCAARGLAGATCGASRKADVGVFERDIEGR